ncbi:hypothetical protein [Burkholderia ubonensis]|uniref:Uncharacterized protein n=1 Tax=Burkholderia ubonensis subsp. mesacidophila TaxID=265293 RepID=A0A2A4ET77_9BURK|nr:hypothetical protein [Burkholderia ubonensis]PCE24823.1 hypothetical protein BZL54_31845 [Burkholderia ubonensis subsp. mesacidophila]
MKVKKAALILCSSLALFSAAGFSAASEISPKSGAPGRDRIATTIQTAQGQSDIDSLLKKLNFQRNSASDYDSIAYAIKKSGDASAIYSQNSPFSSVEIKTTYPTWTNVKNGDELSISWRANDSVYLASFSYVGDGNSGKWEKVGYSENKNGREMDITPQSRTTLSSSQEQKPSASLRSVSQPIITHVAGRITGKVDVYTVKVGSKIQGIYGASMNVPGWVGVEGVGTDIVVFQVRADGMLGYGYEGYANATIVRE